MIYKKCPYLPDSFGSSEKGDEDLRKRIIFFLFMIVSALVVSENEVDDSLFVKISDDIYKIGEITINKQSGEIEFPAEFNMESKPIELLLCGKNGKLHESVLKTDIVPSQLQVSLLLLGYEYGQNIEFQGQDRTPEGDSLLIFVEWIDSLNNKIKVRIEKLAFNVAEKKEMRETFWIFSGSQVLNGTFMADVEGSIITTYHDPFTIIDNPLSTGNDDTLYIVNSRIVPPKGTKARIIIKPFN